ncbi:predicted protein [Aspergillus terreus NIH2624]|uniref:Uncharacterized protein n=1 Tax=Aspergillus terreus (strain NIH 2624 / FGSC A1156) TaxID=341663 RepID=Q0CCX2_ASPTN|nr:uncharacterized protein ATEG_08462 [Aspergillus terreus NIH2624]EAU31635.1 predicted protein [Aspergillus terreus NIH2624]
MEPPDPDTADPVEQGVRLLYHTMDQLARKSQRTVSYCRQAIRMEAVRTQAHELPHRPLLAYMDALLEPRERACLEFCVELLNQRHRTHEYESALVCVMAVLGRGRDGWRDPKSYPPILSRVIKIARFFVVEKALWLDPAAMQTLLDWRTYGLRVHYNSTTPGHIMWQGTDERLYKELRFTMGDFRARAAEYPAYEHRYQHPPEYISQQQAGHIGHRVPQGLLCQQRREDYPPIRAARGRRAHDLLPVAGAAIRRSARHLAGATVARAARAPLHAGTLLRRF